MANFSPYEEGGVTGGQNENELRRKALLDQLQGQVQGQLPGPPPDGSAAGAVAGGGFAGPLPADHPQTADTPAPTTPVTNPLQLGQYASKMGGWNTDKFNDPNASEKYKIGRVMSQFDPKAGVTPELLKALNDLGLAEFSGQGDQLTVKNTKNDPRFGTGGTADVVHGLKGQNEDTSWAPWFVDDQSQAQAGGGDMASGGQGTMPWLQNDAMSGLMSGDFLKKILGMAQGQVGAGATDRNALLSLLG